MTVHTVQLADIEVEPSEEQRRSFELARHAAVQDTPYLTAMIYLMVPRYAAGGAISVDDRAVLSVGPNYLSRHDGTVRSTRRMGQQISDMAMALVREHHERVATLPSQKRAALASNVELSRLHSRVLVPTDTRAEDPYDMYHERFGLDVREGDPLEVLYAKLSSPAEGYEPQVTFSVDGPESGAGQRTEPYGRTATDITGARQQVADDVLEYAKGVGNAPGDLHRWAEEIKSPPVVPWQRALDNLMSRAMGRERGSEHPTYEYVSRNQGGVGFGYGKPVLAALMAGQPMVEIFIDTSGSMSQEELGIVLGQVAPVFRRNRAKVRVWVGDTDVRNGGTVDNLEDLAKLLDGGGGTNFVNVFDRWRKMPPGQRPNSVFFFTDGCGPAPARCPLHGCEVNWVLVGALARKPNVVGTSRPVEYGSFIRVPPRTPRRELRSRSRNIGTTIGLW